MPQNISVMSTISIGSSAQVIGPDCGTATYSLSAGQAGALDGSLFAAQSEEQITVFFPTVSSGGGFVFKGRRVTESVITLNQPTSVSENTLLLFPPGKALPLPLPKTSFLHHKPQSPLLTMEKY
jgi:hypothetical protein